MFVHEWRNAARLVTTTLTLALAASVLSALPARADETGTISGYITAPDDFDDPNWWQGVSVIAQTESDGWGASVDSNGYYEFTDLPEGEYVLQFTTYGYSDEEGTWTPINLISEFYDDATTYDDATRVQVYPGSSFSADATLEAGGTITGHVTAPDDFDDPNWWQGVSVSASSESGEGSSASLDSDGNYTITGLTPGEYVVEFNTYGYSDEEGAWTPINLISEFYDDATTYDDATRVQVIAGSSFSADATLEAGATITGHVTAPDDFDDPNWWQGVSVSAQADDDYRDDYVDDNGNYTITGLTPGEYVIRFRVGSYWGDDGEVEVNLSSEYFDDAANYDDATRISLAAGETFTADADLDAGATITGHVTAPDDFDDPNWWQGVRISADNADNHGWDTSLDSDGKYTIAGLKPGDYVVRFNVGSYWGDDTEVEVNLASEYFDDAANYDDATWISLAAGETFTADADLDTGATITGHVTAPDDFDDPNWWQGVRVTAKNEDGEGATAELDSEGNFTIAGLTPGEYVIRFYVSTYWDDDTEVDVNLASEYFDDAANYDDATRISLAAGETFTADADLDTGGTITGQVTAPEDFDDPNWWQGVTVAAMNADGDWIQDTQLASDGSYTLNYLAPGDHVIRFWVSGYDVDGEWVEAVLASEYYNNQHSYGAATRVRVAAGEASIADVELEYGGTITGRVTVPEGFEDSNWWRAVSVLQSLATGNSCECGGGVNLDENGNYTLTGLEPGEHALLFSVGSYWMGEERISVNLSSEYYDNQTSFKDATRVTVTSSATSVANALLESTFTTTTVPTISGTASMGNTLTATPGTWSPTASFAYQWSRDGVAIVDATAQTYELVAADAGTTITVAVTGSKAGYASVTKTSTGRSVAQGTFATAPTPTISGTPAVGATLTATPGTWSPSASFEYRWYRDGEEISGASGATYAVHPNDLDRTITVEVTGSAPGFVPLTKTSGGTVIETHAFSAAPTPSINGTPAVGSTLIAAAGTWSPTASLSYRWYRDGGAIAGATGSSYKLVESDLDTTITVRITASAAGYVTTTKTSAGVSIEAQAFTATGSPAIIGTVSVGSTLTATPGTWSPTPTLQYRWYRNGGAISGATGATYKVVAADAGATITVKVTGSRAGFATVTQASAGKAVPKAFASAPTPTISGTLRSGYTLTAKTGTWSPSASLTYQWYRSGSKISGATKSSYKLTTSDRGKNITVKVTGSKAGYTAVAKTSGTTYVPKVFTKSPTPKITGTARSGYTLKVTRGTWSPAPSYSYQWYRNGAKISGATKSSYKLTSKDKGKKITVRVYAKKSGYLTSYTTSASKTVAR